MTEITKYSVIQCDLLAIQTGLIHIGEIHNKCGQINRDSVLYRLYGGYIESGAQIAIDEPEFVAKVREVFVAIGLKTAVLNAEPNVVIVYYNDSYNRMVQQIVDANYLTIRYTSFMSPKQVSMTSRL